MSERPSPISIFGPPPRPRYLFLQVPIVPIVVVSWEEKEEDEGGRGVEKVQVPNFHGSFLLRPVLFLVFNVVLVFAFIFTFVPTLPPLRDTLDVLQLLSRDRCSTRSQRRSAQRLRGRRPRLMLASMSVCMCVLWHLAFNSWRDRRQRNTMYMTDMRKGVCVDRR
ncbi:hypothetical protein F5880DRAFT_667739 [Lentinula raphanica]|nr:hypothetical protein F5880DRAFT_667739 [Lentinula raphanica]